MGPCFGTIAALTKRNKHTKVVTILDNVIPHEHRIGDATFTKYYLSKSDGFIAMSKKVMEDLTLFTKSNNRVLIPHPIYDNFGAQVTKEEGCRKLNLDPLTKYILFFGFIRGYKGLDLLLQAMAEPGMKESGIKLIVAGEFYENAQPYHDIIAARGISEQLILATDFIPDGEVKYFFGAADLIVRPYKTATQSGISQMAYHFEKPMVVTNVGGLPDIVPHGKAGYVVEPEPTAISTAILDYFNGGKQEILKRGVLEEKKQYSWSRISQGIVSLSEAS
jgi:glycosyltransferase involved in cell wall biosynthesis